MSEIKLEIKMDTKLDTKSEVIIEVRNETKERILAKSAELFMRYGVKSITMDEIAREAGVSKKTIYQFFTDKDDLVFNFGEYHLASDCMEIESLNKLATNPLEEIIFLTQHMRKKFTNINPTLLFDIRKLYPKAWDSWKTHKNTFIVDTMKDNMRRGIEQGLYRTDINMDILALVRLEQIELAFNPEIFHPSKFSIVEIQTQIMSHFTRGIVTEKGYKMLEELEKQEQLRIE